MDYLISAVGVLLAFGVVIFIHEMGHFLVAKWNGVKVERFSFGLGPEALGFTWGETRYCLAWIPLGGEVRMAGEMEPGADLTAVRDPREFFAKTWYQRVSIVLAGPAMNYVLAWGLFVFVFLLWGNPSPSGDPVVGELLEGGAAQAAGLRTGDRVLSVAGKDVMSWSAMATVIHQSPEQPVELRVETAGVERVLTVTPKKDPVTGTGLIGIAPLIQYAPLPLRSALRQGFFQTSFWTKHTLSYLGQKIIHREKPDLSGPIGIAGVIAKSTKSGPQDYLFLVALISLGIGLFNLFPIPMLDGGHLVYFLWEGVFRKPVPQKAVQMANTVGMVLLIGVLVFATYSDVRRIASGRRSSSSSVSK